MKSLKLQKAVHILQSYQAHTTVQSLSVSSKRLQLHGEIVDPRLARRAILPQAGSVLTWFLL